MTNEQMITIILSILIPMFAGFGWIMNRIFKLEDRMNLFSLDIRSLDARLSRIEGYLEGRDRSKSKTGTES